MYYYGYFLMMSDDYSEYKDEAIKYIKKTINKGNSEAMLFYVNLLYKGFFIDGNIPEAIKYFKKAIHLKKSDAMIYYASLHIDGKPLYIRLYKLAAEKGNPYAMYEYAQLTYIKGFSIYIY